jgi:hypothetical protein
MARTARTAQKSKRDRISTKVHDRIAMARVNAALRAQEEEYDRYAHWTVVRSGRPLVFGFDAEVIG